MTTGFEQRLRREACEFVEARAKKRVARQDALPLASLLAGVRIEAAYSVESGGGHAFLCKRLRMALRRERGKARVGSPSYSFNRHLVLHRTLEALEAQAV